MTEDILKVRGVEEVISTLFPKTEPLTEELYQELLKEGFSKENLDQVKALGWGFDRKRMCFTSLG